MIKRIAALVMALLLMVFFYLYALLQEDEETKRTDQWVVAGQYELPEPREDILSTDPAVLAAAMGLPLPLPRALESGRVRDDRYHGYRVRRLDAFSGDTAVRSVLPASAAPLIRDSELVFESTDKTMMSYPLMRAAKDGHVYYYLSDEQAAFIIRFSDRISDDEALSALIIANP